jgi:tetratricopeptide (TPR) repeat protein
MLNSKNRRFNQRAKGFIFLILIALSATVVRGKADDGSVLQKGIDLYEAEKYEKAQEILQPLAEENAEAAYYLGRCSLNQDDIDEALKWLEKAVELDDSQSKYYLLLGDIYGRKASNAGIFKAPGYAKKVKKNFLKAVELDPDNLQARFALMQYYLQAPGIVGGSTEKAAEQAEEIKKRDKAWGHQAYALVYQDREDYEAAEKEFLEAIEEDPENLEMQYALGYFYQRREKYNDAFAVFENILKSHPDEINALYQIGRTGALSGLKSDRAVACLQNYLLLEPGERNPSLDWAHYRLGMIFMKSGITDSARVHFQAALELNPDHKEAKKALKKLK